MQLASDVFFLILKEVGLWCLNGARMEQARMKVPVIFVTGQVGHLHAYTLDYLIRENEIVAFRRAEGWVRIGQDPIRKAQQPLMKSGNRRDDFMSKRTES